MIGILTVDLREGYRHVGCRNRDDPRRGVTGVVGGSGSGGVEPNPLGSHGGCNRRESLRAL
jgi:hypothetical protein